MSFVNGHSDRIVASSIVVAELYAGVRGDKGDAEQVALASFLSLFRIVPVSDAIARLGGFYERDYGGSHGIGLADAVVTATANLEDAELKTLDVGHYPMFEGMGPAYRK